VAFVYWQMVSSDKESVTLRMTHLCCGEQFVGETSGKKVLIEVTLTRGSEGVI